MADIKILNLGLFVTASLVFSPSLAALYYSFVEKCDNYSDVGKDKAANQPQIIGKRVPNSSFHGGAIVS